MLFYLLFAFQNITFSKENIIFVTEEKYFYKTVLKIINPVL